MRWGTMVLEKRIAEWGDMSMSGQPAGSARAAADAQASAPQQTQRPERMERDAHEMPCPVCGEPMPDLKGGKATICPNCGFKDSCCY